MNGFNWLNFKEQAWYHALSQILDEINKPLLKRHWNCFLRVISKRKADAGREFWRARWEALQPLHIASGSIGHIKLVQYVVRIGETRTVSTQLLIILLCNNIYASLSLSFAFLFR